MAINGGYESMQNGGPIHHASKMVEEAKALKSALSSSATQLSNSLDLRGRVQRNPVAMVLAAAGVGYILGGGLFSPVTSKLLKVGLRAAIIPLVKSQLGALAGMAGQQPAEPPIGSAV